MRVIGGKYRGLVLAEFKGRDIRPTADRVKESLFNIISSEVASSRVLDLFCGSGSLGIECLSRGASFVCFNDISPDSIAVLNKNLARMRGEVEGDPLAIAGGNGMAKVRKRRRIIVVGDGLTPEELQQCGCGHYWIKDLQKAVDALIEENPDCRICALSNGSETFLYE